ncbi:hypothetical protein BH20ACI4_BH20ACI4_20790 [soil metagenome]
MSKNSSSEKSLGEIIAEARKHAGLSLRAVAAKISIKFPYLADIEKDRRIPSEKVLRALSEQEELDLDFDALMSKAGRLGEEAEIYIKQHPIFGSLIREISKENLTDSQLQQIKEKVIALFRSAKSGN